MGNYRPRIGKEKSSGEEEKGLHCRAQEGHSLTVRCSEFPRLFRLREQEKRGLETTDIIYERRTT